jgi:hypothetical protein
VIQERYSHKLKKLVKPSTKEEIISATSSSLHGSHDEYKSHQARTGSSDSRERQPQGEVRAFGRSNEEIAILLH